MICVEAFWSASVFLLEDDRENKSVNFVPRGRVTCGKQGNSSAFLVFCIKVPVTTTTETCDAKAVPRNRL